MSQKFENQLQRVWEEYTESEYYTEVEELDSKRRNRVSYVKELIDKFLSGTLDLHTFKSKNDGENKRHDLWGFKGYNGQMFFNMVTNTAEDQRKLQNFKEILRTVLKAPDSKKEAKTKIGKLTDFVHELREEFDDLRKAPNLRSIPYFLSYFWHIQDPKRYPIYFTTMVNALSDLAIWEPSEDLGESYVDFWELTDKMLSYLSQRSENELNFWDVEHAFWHWQHREEQGETTEESQPQELSSPIPDSYIPPIVSVLPELANHTKKSEKFEENTGKSVDSLFESRLVKYFQILGFDVEKLGQGRGRNPDGIVRDPQNRYAIIYDAKAHSEGYRVSTREERKFQEYIEKYENYLRSSGVRNIYFAVISGTFRGTPQDVIHKLKLSTGINEVLFIEVQALLELLERYLRDPTTFDLGSGGVQHFGVQELFAQSGIITPTSIREAFKK